ncbi:MAG TPA: right-handed parallel beta-helix repeat-containing protein [Verrucomicrobiae bacterium]|nr:right-handed parallel beta-helix repeat-containing protein [Verrucomicrobiae bacterium]
MQKKSAFRFVVATFLAALGVASLSASLMAATVSLPTNATDVEIQAALDSLPAAGGEVVLARGTYTVRQPIILQRDNLTLRGAGLDTILFLADNANCPVVILGVPQSPSPHAVKNVRLANVFIDGNRRHQQVERWHRLADGGVINNNGVEIRNVMDTVVEGVVCARCRSGGVVTAAVNRRLTVRNLTSFDNQFDGLACYLTEDSQFSQLNLHDNLCAGISLDLDFNRNRIQDAVLTNNDLGIFMRQSCSNTFDGLTIRHSRNHGVFMAQTAVCGASGWSLAPGTACIGNKFANLMISNSGGKAFVINDPSCTNNILHQCSFENNPKGGFVHPKAMPILATALMER